MQQKHASITVKVLLASVLALLVFLVLPNSHGDGDGSAECGLPSDVQCGPPVGPESPFVGEWRVNDRSDDLQAYCDENHAGTVCVEWCEVESGPTGMLCCIDPGALSSGFRLGQCTHWVS